MSLLSSFMGSRLVVLPSKPTLKLYGGGVSAPPPSSSSAVPMVIECSSRPQKKGTAHHRKTRPKKTAPWDVRRKPTVYAPLPKLPSEWSFATTTETSDSVVATAAAAAAAELPSSSSETSDSVVAAAEVPSSSDNNNDDA